MSADDDTDLPGGWEAAAAEYVLGLLSEDEAQGFEARMREDPDLEQDVAAWRDHFATLTDPVAAQAPPPRVWGRIESDLFKPARKPIWRQLLPYGVGAVLGATLAWAVFVSGVLVPQEVDFRAALEPVEGTLALTARFDAQSGVLAVDLAQGDVPADRALELWLIAGEGVAPVSLGLLDASGGAVRSLRPLLAERVPGATLAVSEEPPGGSPTGAPTGPVRAAGQLIAT
ncbi:anti-sigma factor [Citreimonas salinaria]|uniref:Regulator of SigK n=1 Tax=Citreimonas salinaria TaxID=321339 RepID=A0A1H3G0K5_9RHOB|nr:anti-sigma factor [Citreimonas salinaria]SDX96690.1 Anti-sigma-K factor RskA [Citreimonas salinaria]